MTTPELALRNARIVLEDEVICGSLLIKDDTIIDVSTTVGTVGDDLEGDYLVPGLVEVHTDHLEYHYEPRPKTYWSPIPAVLAHDTQLAGSGVTTVLDAVRIGAYATDDDAASIGRNLADAIEYAGGSGLLRAEHWLHLRCEVSAPNCVEMYETFADDPHVRLVSLMDHTPGQRQFADLEAYKTYVLGKGKTTETELPAMMVALQERAELYSDLHRTMVAKRATDRGLVLATHDDATPAHVEESVSMGVRIAEFPTTVAAAQAAHDHGQLTVMGAPNIVKGGSQSGNVAASDLLALGLLDVLSSDYVPSSLLLAAFMLASEEKLTLVDSVKLVSANPARAVGLDDRGSIALGKRADLVRVTAHPVGLDGDARVAQAPVVRCVWRQGRRVA